MSIQKITDAERNNVCVTGLPDTPGLSVNAMQQRFDGLGNLAIDKVNEVVDAINNGDIASPIKDPNTGEFININEAITLIREEMEDLKNIIVSVSELPENPDPNKFYAIWED